MQAYRPLVLIDGKVQELPLADTLQTSALPTPPTLVSAGDVYFGDVAVLLHLNGDFTNVKSTVITPVGNATTSTAQKKFGTHSALFDGTGDYLSAPAGAWTNLSNRDFTIEGWFYFTNLSANRVLFAWNKSANSYYGCKLMVGVSGAGISAMLSESGTAGAPAQISSATLVVNTWYHIAVTRTGQYVTCWLDGVQQGTLALSSAVVELVASPTEHYIGGDNANYMHGYIDDFRFTLGVARYSANFSVPTAEYPNVFPEYSYAGSTAAAPYFASVLVHAEPMTGVTPLTVGTTQIPDILSSESGDVMTGLGEQYAA